jgi:nucleotide-binding universal stress UspA family protein
MYNRIIIAVDGSDEARHAATRGLELARVFDAAVEVVHVVEQRALRLTRTATENTQLRERGNAILDEIEELASEGGQSVATELREGKPAVELSEFAAERDADLLVIGRQGMTGLSKRLLGGVTEQVLQRTSVPVFVVPDTDAETGREAAYSRVLLPTDGSENAEVATPYGVVIAREYDAEMHVLNVIDLQAAGGPFNAGGLDENLIERLEANGREAVDSVADEISESDSGLAVKRAVTRTKSHAGTSAGIRRYVAETDIDLVVMGSHGRSSLGRQALGSVASAVLRTVDVPVLVAKRPM